MLSLNNKHRIKSVFHKNSHDNFSNFGPWKASSVRTVDTSFSFSPSPPLLKLLPQSLKKSSSGSSIDGLKNLGPRRPPPNRTHERTPWNEDRARLKKAESSFRAQNERALPKRERKRERSPPPVAPRFSPSPAWKQSPVEQWKRYNNNKNLFREKVPEKSQKSSLIVPALNSEVSPLFAEAADRINEEGSKVSEKERESHFDRHQPCFNKSSSLVEIEKALGKQLTHEKVSLEKPSTNGLTLWRTHQRAFYFENFFSELPFFGDASAAYKNDQSGRSFLL